MAPPFPYMPMLAITASLVSAMVVQMSVFVYAGYMVEYLGVVDDKDEAGYYAGALSAAYMFGRVCSSHVWGLIADSRGRRFVLLFGILSNIVLSVVFGCSTTFTEAFIARFLLGLLNGVLVVSRTIVSEVCTSKEQETIGMGFVTSAWTLGGVLGPGVGGLLAEPAKFHPHIFSESGIFGRHPYLLPNLVGAGLALLALPLVFAFIKEDTQHASAASGNPTTKAWYSSWYCFGRGGRDDDNGGSQHEPAKAAAADRASAANAKANANANVINANANVNVNANANAESSLAFENYGTRILSWMQVESTIMPPTNTRRVNVSVEANANAKANVESALALEECGNRKPSWMQVESMIMPPITIAKNNGQGQDSERLGGTTADDTKPESLLAQAHVRLLLFTNVVFAFTYSGFDEVYPLWALSSVARGGLDWSSPQIGKVFFTCGLMVLVFEVFLAVPYLTPWLGVKTSQRLGTVFEISVYILVPLVSRVSGYEHLSFIFSVLLLFACYTSTNSYMLCLNLTINNATGRARRAELNGLSVTIESVARAVSPMACSALFAFSINGSFGYPFDSHFVFYLLASTRLVAASVGWNKLTDNGNME